MMRTGAASLACVALGCGTAAIADADARSLDARAGTASQTPPDVVRGRTADVLGDSVGGPHRDLAVVEGQFDRRSGTLTAIVGVDASRSPQGTALPLADGTVITVAFGQLDAAGKCAAGSAPAMEFRGGDPVAVWRIPDSDDVRDALPGGPPNLSMSDSLHSRPDLVGATINCLTASLSTVDDPARVLDVTPVVAMPALVEETQAPPDLPGAPVGPVAPVPVTQPAVPNGPTSRFAPRAVVLHGRPGDARVAVFKLTPRPARADRRRLAFLVGGELVEGSIFPVGRCYAHQVLTVSPPRPIGRYYRLDLVKDRVVQDGIMTSGELQDHTLARAVRLGTGRNWTSKIRRYAAVRELGC